MSKENKTTYGGARAGAGRKPRPVKTKTIAFRVDAQLYEEVKAKYGKNLNKMLKEWFEELRDKS